MIEYAEASYSAAFDLCKRTAQKLYPNLDFGGVEEDEEDIRTETHNPAEPTTEGEEDEDDILEGDTPPKPTTGGHSSDVEISSNEVAWISDLSFFFCFFG